MENSKAKFIQGSSRSSRALLDLLGQLSKENVLYYGAADYDAKILQADIDGDPALAGLTAATLADAQSAKAQILTILTNALPALAVVSELY